jgi:hypothetical protein
MTTSPAAGSVPPDPRSLEDDLLRALSVLARAKASGSSGWLTATQISGILRDEFAVRVHWKTIETALLSDKAQAARRKHGGRWEFAIMSAGEKRLFAAQPIVFVQPADAVMATLSLHQFFGALKNPIRVCDPYLDGATIEHLEACPTGAEIRLLTMNVKDTGPLRRLVQAAQGQRSLSIRVVKVKNLHDRYIIDDREMLLLGTSLNGFGKKQCFSVRAGEDIRETMRATFDAQWATATPWP